MKLIELNDAVRTDDRGSYIVYPKQGSQIILPDGAKIGIPQVSEPSEPDPDLKPKPGVLDLVMRAK